MKKVLLATIIMLQLYESKAQSISVNYTKEFVSDSKSPFTGKKFTPYALSGIGATYSQQIKKSPVTFNVSANRRRKEPPRYIKYPDPPVYFKYATENKIEADSASFSNTKLNSIDLMVGAGYNFGFGNKFILTLNADFGVSLNNKLSLNYYYQKRLTKSIEAEKTQFIVNPNVQAKYFITKNVGLNVNTGYNSRGGFNGGVGVVIAARPWFVKCLVCYRWHRLGHCRSRIADAEPNLN